MDEYIHPVCEAVRRGDRRAVQAACRELTEVLVGRRICASLSEDHLAQWDRLCEENRIEADGAAFLQAHAPGYRSIVAQELAAVEELVEHLAREFDVPLASVRVGGGADE